MDLDICHTYNILLLLSLPLKVTSLTGQKRKHGGQSLFTLQFRMYLLLLSSSSKSRNNIAPTTVHCKVQPKLSLQFCHTQQVFSHNTDTTVKPKTHFHVPKAPVLPLHSTPLKQQMSSILLSDLYPLLKIQTDFKWNLLTFNNWCVPHFPQQLWQQELTKSAVLRTNTEIDTHKTSTITYIIQLDHCNMVQQDAHTYTHTHQQYSKCEITTTTTTTVLRPFVRDYPGESVPEE